MSPHSPEPYPGAYSGLTRAGRGGRLIEAAIARGLELSLVSARGGEWAAWMGEPGASEAWAEASAETPGEAIDRLFVAVTRRAREDAARMPEPPA